MAAMVRLFRFVVPVALFTGAGLTLHPSVGMTQGRDMGCSPTLASPCSGGSSGGGSYSPPAYTPPAVYQPSPAELQQRQVVALQQQGTAQFRAGKYTEALRLFELSLKLCVAADDIKNLRGNIGNTHSQLGTLAYKRGDVEQALRQYELANQYNPAEAVISDSLKNLRGEIAARQQAKIAEQQDKAAANHMQKAIQGFAQTLNAAPASGGLDFDGRASGTPPPSAGGNGGGLDFAAVVPASGQTTPAPALPSGDPRVVDASRAPSGLSKPVENAIAGAYANSPPGVSDRVRKGFQAVADRDWKVAKAWFEEALNRDPTNAGLKRLIELSDAAPARTGKVATLAAGQQLQMPGPEDWKLIFPGLQALEDKEAMDALFGLRPSR
jgi:tetratricopeptide (TPR) repeat protein